MDEITTINPFPLGWRKQRHFSFDHGGPVYGSTNIVLPGYTRSAQAYTPSDRQYYAHYIQHSDLSNHPSIGPNVVCATWRRMSSGVGRGCRVSGISTAGGSSNPMSVERRRYRRSLSCCYSR